MCRSAQRTSVERQGGSITNFLYADKGLFIKSFLSQGKPCPPRHFQRIPFPCPPAAFILLRKRFWKGPLPSCNSSPKTSSSSGGRNSNRFKRLAMRHIPGGAGGGYGRP